MMDYEGVKSVVCDAQESDWLDISYSQRYVKNEKPKKIGNGNRFSSGWKIVTVAVLCVAVLAVMLLSDNDFKNDVFSAVKTAVASIFPTTNSETENKINIPCNLSLLNVEDGVMTFGGGRAAMSLTEGKVTEVTDTGLTVSYDEDTSVIYNQLISVMVAVGDNLSENSLLGKYDEQYTACIMMNGEVVKQVVGSETQLTWNI